MNRLSLRVFRGLMVSVLLGFATSAQAALSKHDRDCIQKLRNKDLKTLPASSRVDQTSANLSAFLSESTGGRVLATVLDAALRAQYMIEVPNRSGVSSKAIEVKMVDTAEQLTKNIRALKEIGIAGMSTEQIAVHQVKMELTQSAVPLMALAAKRYEGSDPDMVLARDAYARQLETAVNMTSLQSVATADEIRQHLEVVWAVVREKEINPSLTDAEATLLGVRTAYREGFERRCKDGSCKVPSHAVLEAGAKTRLKDLKDCI